MKLKNFRLICCFLLFFLIVLTLAACETPFVPPSENGGDSHDWGSWVVEKQSTCTTEGKQSRVCQECGEIEEIAISKTDHALNFNNECTVCGTVIEPTVGLEYSRHPQYKNNSIVGYYYRVTGAGAARDEREIIIPAYQNGDPVTEIAAEAFAGCKKLEKIYIPGSITQIGFGAFSGCTKLSNISLPQQLTHIGTDILKDTPYYNNIANWDNGLLYNGTYLLSIKDSLASCTVRDTTTIIASDIFSSSALQELYIDFYIDSNKLSNTGIKYSKIKKVSLICNRYQINDTSVLDCLPTTVEELTLQGYYIYESDSLATRFPELKHLGTTEEIENGALSGLGKLESLAVNGNRASVLAKLFGDKDYPGGIQTKYRYVDRNGRSAQDLWTNVVPLSLKKVHFTGTTIQASASKGLGLSEISIAKSIRTIECHGISLGYNLSDPTNESDLSLPDVILYYEGSIDDWFAVKNSGFHHNGNGIRWYCDGEEITSLRIPESKTEIGNEFAYFSGLENIEIHDKVTRIGNSAFAGCAGLTKITIPESITSIGIYAFYNCTGLTDIVVPDSVTSIGERAFENCTGLISATLGNGITKIINNNTSSRGGLFQGCSNLSNVALGNGLTSIHPRMFQGCSKLKSIVLPEGVTAIEQYAFKNCINLKNIVVPDSVTSIGEGAFLSCTNLCDVSLGENIVRIGSKSGLDGAFEGCISLKNIVIPDAVTDMFDSTFQNCTGLESATIGNGITTIYGSTFEGCTNLTSVIIGNQVAKIGEHAFLNCTKLASISIPDNVTSIGARAFKGCVNLAYVSLGEGISDIGIAAFRGCTNLASIIIPSGVTQMGLNVFADCTNLKDIYCRASSQPPTWPQFNGWCFPNCNPVVHWGYTD